MTTADRWQTGQSGRSRRLWRTAVVVLVAVGAWVPTTAQPAGALTPTENFISAVYEDFLFRAPNASELAWWSAYISGNSRSAMVTSVLNGDEFALLWVAGVRLFYLEGLDVDDDPTFATDLASLDTSNDFVTAEVSVLAGSIFFTASGSTHTGYVTALYDEILQRAPSPTELSYWVGRLDLGTSTRAQAARSFIRSTEAANRRVGGPSGATSCSATSLNGVSDLSAGSYCIVLDRTASSGDVTYWGGYLVGATGQLTALWTALAGSTEYFNKAQL